MQRLLFLLLLASSFSLNGVNDEDIPSQSVGIRLGDRYYKNEELREVIASGSDYLVVELSKLWFEREATNNPDLKNLYLEQESCIRELQALLSQFPASSEIDNQIAAIMDGYNQKNIEIELRQSVLESRVERGDSDRNYNQSQESLNLYDTEPAITTTIPSYYNKIPGNTSETLTSGPLPTAASLPLPASSQYIPQLGYNAYMPCPSYCGATPYAYNLQNQIMGSHLSAPALPYPVSNTAPLIFNYAPAFNIYNYSHTTFPVHLGQQQSPPSHLKRLYPDSPTPILDEGNATNTMIDNKNRGEKRKLEASNQDLLPRQQITSEHMVAELFLRRLKVEPETLRILMDLDEDEFYYNIAAIKWRPYLRGLKEEKLTNAFHKYLSKKNPSNKKSFLDFEKEFREKNP